MPRLLRLLAYSALVVAALSGCSAQRTLYRPNKAERALLKEPPLDVSVVVQPWAKPLQGRSPRAYGAGAANLVIKSNAFRQATYDTSHNARADLVATSAGDYCNTAIIPLFTIVTLGLFPTVWKESQCDGITFRAYGTDTGGVTVHVRRSGTAVLGWAALPLGALPGWSWRSGRGQKGYRQAFRLAVIEKRRELEHLAHATPRF